jgi:hypothetical protein
MFAWMDLYIGQSMSSDKSLKYSELHKNLGSDNYPSFFIAFIQPFLFFSDIYKIIRVKLTLW